MSNPHLTNEVQEQFLVRREPPGRERLDDLHQHRQRRVLRFAESTHGFAPSLQLANQTRQQLRPILRPIRARDLGDADRQQLLEARVRQPHHVGEELSPEPASVFAAEGQSSTIAAASRGDPKAAEGRQAAVKAHAESKGPPTLTEWRIL